MSDLTESFSIGVIFQYSAVSSMFISSAIFYFALARMLSVSVVGSISLLYAIMNILTTIFIFGLGNGLQHYLSYHLARNNNEIIKKLIIRTTFLAILLAGLAYISVYFSSYYVSILFFHSTGYILSVRIIGIAISMNVIINVFASMLLGLNQYKKYSIVYTFFYVFLYFFPLGLLVVLKDTVYLLYGIAIIEMIYAIFFISLVYKYYFKLGKNSYVEKTVEPYKNVIFYSVPLFFASIMNTSATYIDRIVVSYFINLSYLGIYNFALVVASAATIMIMPISNLLIPKLSSFFSLNNIDAFNKSIRMLLNIGYMLYVPAALGIAALSRSILYVFAGPEYLDGYMPLMIIMFSTSIFAGSVVLSAGISSVRKTRIFVMSAGMSMISNVGLSILLIPRFYLLGAAISYSSMNAVSFLIVYYYARKFRVSNYDVGRIVRIWAASLIMFFTVFELQQHFAYSMLYVFIFIIAGLLIYIGEIKAFKLISTDEMKYILDIIPDKFGVLKYLMRHLPYNDRTSGNDRLFRFIK